MKKLFLFLSTALFLIGSNVMAADVVDLEIGKASAFGFQQDAYQFGPGMHNSDKLHSTGTKITLEGANANGYSNVEVLKLDTIPNYNWLGRNSFLYVHDSPDKGDFATGGNYFIDADDNTEYIYLWAQMHGLEGTSFDYNSNMSDFNLPNIEVTVTDVDGKVVEHKTFLRGSISGNSVMNRVDTLADFDTDADWTAFKERIKTEGSIPTILYRVAIGSHTEVTYSWKVTYPADHENANVVRTWTTKIKKSANLKTIATLKGLYLFNANAGENLNKKEEDEFKEMNLLKNFNKDGFDYTVTGTGTEGTRLYFEATMPGSTFKVTYKGDTFPGVAGGATLTYFDVPAPGGPVEIIVTATNGETRKTYTVNIVPKVEVKPLSPISLGIYVDGDGKLLASSPNTAPDTLLYLSQYDSAVVNEKGIPYFAEIIINKSSESSEEDTIIVQSATGNMALYYKKIDDDWKFTDKDGTQLYITAATGATITTKEPAGPAKGEEPDLIFKTFALTNGVDTFPITKFNPIFKDDGEVKYDVSVPNKNDASLQPAHTLYDEAAFKSKKYAFAKKTIINAAGNVELELTLMEPKQGEKSTLENMNDKAYWDTVKVKSAKLIAKSGKSALDSAVQVPVKYTLTLQNNKAGFKFLTLFYDSLKTPVELDKPISDTVDLYKAVGYVPDKIKKVFAVVGSHGNVTLKGDLGTPTKMSDYSANKDYKVYEFDAKSWADEDSKNLIIEDKAEAGNSKQVTITLQKEYNLKLKSLSITQSGKTLFSRKESALKDSTDFDVLLDPDFEIGSLLDITLNPIPATKSKLVSVKRSLHVENDVFAFTFTVYDPDGHTQDYHVNLSYPTSNANLDYLTTSVGLVSPPFSPDIEAYELVVADSVRSLRVLAGAQDPHAVVKLETASSRNVGVTIDLDYKTTVVPIQVVAPDTKTTRDYTLTIVNPSLPVEETGIKAVTLDQMTIAAKSGALSITSPVAERIYIYSVTGNVISSVDKTAGSVVVPVSAKGVTVIKGTSGWVSKVYLK